MGVFLDKLEQWYNKIGKYIVYTIGILVVLYIIVRYKILGMLAPFILAWILAMLLNPFVTWLHKKIYLARGLGTILSMITVLSAILGALSAVIKQLWQQMNDFAASFPYYSNMVIESISNIEERFKVFFTILPAPQALSNLDTVVEQLLSGVGSFLTALIPSVYSIITKVPNIVLFIIVMLIATFFMTKDYYYIRAFIKAQISDSLVNKVVLMQKGVFEAAGGYIKTQLILMIFTFSISLLGLLILKRDYALLISLSIAVVDALPMFGSGAILITWGIYNLFVGNYAVGIGLLGIYGVIVIARQILEPRILSHQIGVYSLVTVMAMYIGYKMIGVLGLIGGPIVVVIFKTLQSVGIIPPFKPMKQK